MRARTLGDVTTQTAKAVDYPGAEAPARNYDLDANGVRIAVHEWGDADAPPLLAVHGGFDFARTYDLFAPRLAAGGWRVVAWDQRGHGDSEHAELYSWDADMRDAHPTAKCQTLHLQCHHGRVYYTCLALRHLVNFTVAASEDTRPPSFSVQTARPAAVRENSWQPLDNTLTHTHTHD